MLSKRLEDCCEIDGSTCMVGYLSLKTTCSLRIQYDAPAKKHVDDYCEIKGSIYCVGMYFT